MDSAASLSQGAKAANYALALITANSEEPLEVEEDRTLHIMEDLTAFMVGANTSTAKSSASEAEAESLRAPSRSKQCLVSASQVQTSADFLCHLYVQ